MAIQRVNFDPAVGDQTGAALVKLDGNCADLDGRVTSATTTANAAMPKAGGSFSGNINTPSVWAGQSAGTVQGVYISWNGVNPGFGSAGIVCNRGLGSGGFTFRTVNATNDTIIGEFNIDGAGRFNNTPMPASDNVFNCGTGSYRWSTVFAASGTISTSDAREKTEVSPLTADEIAAAKELAREIGTYKWLAQIAAKGDDARMHVGMTVQRCMEIMSSHGLEPTAYGFICHDSWEEQEEILSDGQPEILDEATGEVIQPAVEPGAVVVQPYRPAGDRYSFRMDELMFFIARGIEARLADLEARLPAP